MGQHPAEFLGLSKEDYNAMSNKLIDLVHISKSFDGDMDQGKRVYHAARTVRLRQDDDAQNFGRV